MDINQVGDRGGNVSLTKAALRQAQITGHYNEVQIQNNVQYIVDGQFDVLAPADNLNTAIAAITYTGPSTVNVPACNSALFAIWVTKGNTVTVTKGDNVDATKLSGTTGRTGEKVLPFPAVVANAALVGLVRVTAGTGTQFQYGTTNFNATNINTAFVDCGRMPAIPFTS
jgi:hypothetical protein